MDGVSFLFRGVSSAQWTNIMMCEDGRGGGEYFPHVFGHPPAFTTTTTRGGVRHLSGSTSGTSPGAVRRRLRTQRRSMMEIASMAKRLLTAHGGFDEAVVASRGKLATRRRISRQAEEPCTTPRYLDSTSSLTSCACAVSNASPWSLCRQVFGQIGLDTSNMYHTSTGLISIGGFGLQNNGVGRIGVT